MPQSFEGVKDSSATLGSDFTVHYFSLFLRRHIREAVTQDVIGG
jgi:hypothetical protein